MAREWGWFELTALATLLTVVSCTTPEPVSSSTTAVQPATTTTDSTATTTTTLAATTSTQASTTTTAAGPTTTSPVAANLTIDIGNTVVTGGLASCPLADIEQGVAWDLRAEGWVDAGGQEWSVDLLYVATPGLEPTWGFSIYSESATWNAGGTDEIELAYETDGSTGTFSTIFVDLGVAALPDTPGTLVITC